MRFEFATAGRIVFGAGSVKEAGSIVRTFGQRPLVVTGRDVGRAEPLLALLRTAGLEVLTYSVEAEPTTEDAVRGGQRGRDSRCDCVVGFGGGSALDAAKAIAALLTNSGDIFDYLEVVGRAQPLRNAAAPCIAIPTTAGTGSEVTRNAVLASPAHRVKASLRSPHMLPRVALVDPELTYALPPDITASTGLDALTQLIEPYVCSRANPMTDALCVDGIRRVARSLRVAVEEGANTAAREDMAVASLFGGIALANAGLGAVHGFAGPIGGAFSAPHGAICAALLPHVIAANLRALRARGTDAEPLRRYDEVARLLTGDGRATANDAIRWTESLVTALRVPTLSRYGITEGDVPALVTAAGNASSMKANPVRLTPDELRATLLAAL